MAFTYQQIIESDYQTLAEERTAALAELEAARISEDAFRTKSASRQILEISKSQRELDHIANTLVASQQRPVQSNEFGLNKDEEEIARSGYGNLPNREKDRIYAEQKQKLQHLRATGQYRDDQGTVRR